MYIVIKNGVISEVETRLEVASLFDIEINKGKVFFEGKEDTISYKDGEWTEEEIIKDFAIHRLPELVKRSSRNNGIYKVN